jgi:acetoin utilization deacetylase AcuC-like enzyme
MDYDSKNPVEGSYRIQQFFQSEAVALTDTNPNMEKIFRVHAPQYIKKFQNRCNHHARYAEAHTSPQLYKSALIAAGLAVDAANSGDFALVRPPGHHAGKDYGGGFCFINNIAVAVTELLQHHHRICIIDFDGHHGNGTQNIFANNENVLYCSIHQEHEYPYSGKLEHTGSSKATKYCINLPVPAGSGDDVLVDAIACFLNKARQFNAELIAVSAGFDGHHDDKLLKLNYTEAGFYAVGRMIAQSGMKNFAVLEGGYYNALYECVLSYVAGVNDQKPLESVNYSSTKHSVREEANSRIAFLNRFTIRC